MIITIDKSHVLSFIDEDDNINQPYPLITIIPGDTVLFLGEMRSVEQLWHLIMTHSARVGFIILSETERAQITFTCHS